MHPAYEDTPHRRYNPLLDEWVLVSPHRSKRPWKGQVEDAPADERPRHDPKCYLCPGNERAGGRRNPDYAETFVFDNDFPALLGAEAGDAAPPVLAVDGLVRAEPESGLCRVVCFDPRHDLTLPEMPVSSVRRVIDTWAAQYEELAAREDIGHVMIFENKGAMMGCSNPHPHGQIWATRQVPSLAGRKVAAQEAWRRERGADLLMDYLDWERGQGERIVAANEHFTALVPWWAVWPFEAMILPHRPIGAIPEMSEAERDAWAALLHELLVRYDNLFESSFPYSMGINQRPTDGAEHPGVVWHQSFYPPLLRSAVVRKFQVGFEMSGEPQRDITAEQAASRLRDCASAHYSGTGGGPQRGE